MGARRVTLRVVYGSRTWYGHAPGVLASLLALCWHGCCCLLAAAPAVSGLCRHARPFVTCELRMCCLVACYNKPYCEAVGM